MPRRCWRARQGLEVSVMLRAGSTCRPMRLGDVESVPQRHPGRTWRAGDRARRRSRAARSRWPRHRRRPGSQAGSASAHVSRPLAMPDGPAGPRGPMLLPPRDMPRALDRRRQGPLRAAACARPHRAQCRRHDLGPDRPLRRTSRCRARSSTIGCRSAWRRPSISSCCRPAACRAWRRLRRSAGPRRPVAGGAGDRPRSDGAAGRRAAGAGGARARCQPGMIEA